MVCAVYYALHMADGVASKFDMRSCGFNRFQMAVPNVRGLFQVFQVLGTMLFRFVAYFYFVRQAIIKAVVINFLHCVVFCRLLETIGN